MDIFAVLNFNKKIKDEIFKENKNLEILKMELSKFPAIQYIYIAQSLYITSVAKHVVIKQVDVLPCKTRCYIHKINLYSKYILNIYINICNAIMRKSCE